MSNAAAGASNDRRGALLRVARRLIASDASTIGLVPAHETVSIPTVALALAESIAELSGEAVVLVDSGLDGRHYDASGPLTERIRVLRPPPTAEIVDLIEAFVGLQDEKIRTLVDLTGYQPRGALKWAFTSLQAVVVVAIPGATREGDLMAIDALTPPGLWSGVVLFSGAERSSG